MNTNTLNLSEEIMDIFNDPDIRFGSILKLLALEFGENITLKEINGMFQATRPLPTHVINGETFVAGYRGPNIVSEGRHTSAKLVELKQSGMFCKGMFVLPTGQFLYWSHPKDEMRIEEIVALTKQIGNEFTVEVKHEVIASTGEIHAKIVNFIILGVKLL